MSKGPCVYDQFKGTESGRLSSVAQGSLMNISGHRNGKILLEEMGII